MSGPKVQPGERDRLQARVDAVRALCYHPDLPKMAYMIPVERVLRALDAEPAPPPDTSENIPADIPEATR